MFWSKSTNAAITITEDGGLVASADHWFLPSIMSPAAVVTSLVTQGEIPSEYFSLAASLTDQEGNRLNLARSDQNGDMVNDKKVSAVHRAEEEDRSLRWFEDFRSNRAFLAVPPVCLTLDDGTFVHLKFVDDFETDFPEPAIILSELANVDQCISSWDGNEHEYRESWTNDRAIMASGAQSEQMTMAAWMIVSTIALAAL